MNRDPARRARTTEARKPDAAAWQAVTQRDRQADGTFVYIAVTTGIYCRPSCPARHPHRRNVLVLDTAGDAERQGYTACRRCHPRTDELTPAEAAVKAVLEYVTSLPERETSLATLSRVSGLSPNHLQQTFKRIVGLSPKAWVDARRIDRLKQALRSGVSVGDAIYEVGFGSTRAFYERAYEMLGMTPSDYTRGGDGVQITYTLARASRGRVLVAWTDRGRCGLLVGDHDDALVRELRGEFPRAVFVRGVAPAEWIDELESSAVEDPLIAGLPEAVRHDVFRARALQLLRRRRFVFSSLAIRSG